MIQFLMGGSFSDPQNCIISTVLRGWDFKEEIVHYSPRLIHSLSLKIFTAPKLQSSKVPKLQRARKLQRDPCPVAAIQNTLLIALTRGTYPRHLPAALTRGTYPRHLPAALTQGQEHRLIHQSAPSRKPLFLIKETIGGP